MEARRQPGEAMNAIGGFGASWLQPALHARTVQRATGLLFALSLGLGGVRTVRAQVPTPSPWEDSLLAQSWRVRADALFELTQQPQAISRTGRDHLIELLGRELDQTIP